MILGEPSDDGAADDMSSLMELQNGGMKTLYYRSVPATEQGG
jgi:hypothetical protein